MTWGLTWRALYWTLEKPRGQVQYAILDRIVPNDNRTLCLNEIIWKVFSNNFIETQFSIVILYYPIQDSYWTILLSGPGRVFWKNSFQTISLWIYINAPEKSQKWLWIDIQFYDTLVVFNCIQIGQCSVYGQNKFDWF